MIFYFKYMQFTNIISCCEKCNWIYGRDNPLNESFILYSERNKTYTQSQCQRCLGWMSLEDSGAMLVIFMISIQLVLQIPGLATQPGVL